MERNDRLWYNKNDTKKEYLWTFQKFVRKLTQIVKNQLLSGGLFDLEGLEEEIAILENKMTEPDFWNDNIAAQKNVARIK